MVSSSIQPEAVAVITLQAIAIKDNITAQGVITQREAWIVAGIATAN
jgi:hypothetical protein